MERATLDSLSVIMEFVLPVLTKMTFVAQLEDGDDIAEFEPITHSTVAYNFLRRDVRDFRITSSSGHNVQYKSVQLVQPSVIICTIVGAISARWLRAAVNLVLNCKIVRILSLPRMALQTGTQCCIYVGPDGEDVEVELQLVHFQSFRNPL
eukprot:s9063_g2.t1